MKKILVVDDSPSYNQKACQILSKHKYLALTAKDADQGIEIAQAEIPDLILMDVVMPGCSGFEAVRKLSHIPSTSKIPVIFLSSKDTMVDKAWGLKQGAKAYLTKPVNESALISKIKELLGN